MKTFVCLALASAALASPVISVAQSSAPLTRAQVRSELVRIEQAGYHIGDGDETTYPVQIQAAEAKTAAQDSQQAANTSAQDSRQAAENAVGGTTLNGTSAAGSSMHLAQPSSCVGPADYCNTFFGH
jgi:hypothetical protein